MSAAGGRWRVVGLLALGVALAGGRAAGAAEAPEAAGPDTVGVRFLSDFSGRGWLAFFGNQQDDLQDERYVTEGGMILDFALASAAQDRWALRARFDIMAELGTSVTENLPFSPKAMDYLIFPYVEWRRGGWLARLGWEHVCQHLIYKDVDEPWYQQVGSNIPPDVYWNRMVLGGGHAESRPELLWRRLCAGGGRALPRWVGYAEGGVYVREFFGVDPESLYGDTDWRADLTADLKLRLAAGDRWALFAASRTEGLLDGKEEWTVRQRLRLEAVFASGGYGSTVYAGGYPVDDHPRDSREGLVEIGAAFLF